MVTDRVTGRRLGGAHVTQKAVRPETGSPSKNWGPLLPGHFLSLTTHGYTFFGFDLTPDQCDGPCFHVVQKGNLRIELHFRDALPTTVNVVAYAE